jgi:hypothetical protein
MRYLLLLVLAMVSFAGGDAEAQKQMNGTYQANGVRIPAPAGSGPPSPGRAFLDTDRSLLGDPVTFRWIVSPTAGGLGRAVAVTPEPLEPGTRYRVFVFCCRYHEPYDDGWFVTNGTKPPEPPRWPDVRALSMTDRAVVRGFSWRGLALVVFSLFAGLALVGRIRPRSWP